VGEREEARSVSSAFSHYDVLREVLHAYDSIQPFPLSRRIMPTRAFRHVKSR